MLTTITESTTARSAVAGALVLNLPSVYWAFVLPAPAAVAAATLLAILGAALGAIAGWALEAPRRPELRAVRAPARERDRLAA